MTIGNNRPYITALIVPSFAALEAFATQRGLQLASRDQLVAHPVILEHYAEVVKECCKQLSPHEQVKNFALINRDITQDEGEMTATAKLKRRVIDHHFKEMIASLYAQPAKKDLN